MASDRDIPEGLDEFLPWLKLRTEAAWADFETATLEEFRQSGVGGVSWRTGTKWQEGLDSEAIGDLEERWNVRFPEDYRQFLSLLNAPDRGVFSTGWSDEPPYDLQACDDEPSFFDWRRDEEALQAAFQWPLEGLMYDVENDDLWPASWGERPPAAELKDTLSRLVASAPALIPLTGHRYLLGDPLTPGNPVLSVYQSDIIVYGASLRNFLLLEFHGLLGLDRIDANALAGQGISNERIVAIPFWGELILGP